MSSASTTPTTGGTAIPDIECGAERRGNMGRSAGCYASECIGATLANVGAGMGIQQSASVSESEYGEASRGGQGNT